MRGSPQPSRAAVVRAAFACGVLACTGAGSSAGGAAAPAPTSPRAVTSVDAMLAASAEIGALDEREAEHSFRASLNGLQACVSAGVSRVDFIAGEIELVVKIDAARQVREVWAAQSSLGERGIEKCMFDALRAVSWPAPVGGAFGIARSSFEFERRKGAPVPAIWDAGRVAAALEGLGPTLEECQSNTAEGLLITLYIGQDGRAIAGGAASDQPVDEQAVDCVVDALLAAQYPAPEQAPTKVRFRL